MAKVWRSASHRTASRFTNSSGHVATTSKPAISDASPFL